MHKQLETFLVRTTNARFESLGTWTVPNEIRHFAHTLYVCPKCGNMWAKTILSDVDRYLVELRRCAEHGDGTFLRNIFDKRLEYFGLPYALLEREFHLTQNFHETYEKGNPS